MLVISLHLSNPRLDLDPGMEEEVMENIRWIVGCGVTWAQGNIAESYGLLITGKPDSLEDTMGLSAFDTLLQAFNS